VFVGYRVDMSKNWGCCGARALPPRRLRVGGAAPLEPRRPTLKAAVDRLCEGTPFREALVAVGLQRISAGRLVLSLLRRERHASILKLRSFYSNLVVDCWLYSTNSSLHASQTNTHAFQVIRSDQPRLYAAKSCRVAESRNA